MNPNGNGGDRDPRSDLHANVGHTAKSAIFDSVDVKVETYLSETSMTIAQLNALEAGAVVTLGAALNEPVELRVNGVRIAHGELVSVGDKFGVRITSIA